ncbi:MAG: hypothetical protein ABI295_07345 [Xanthomarina sp.]
MRKWIYSFCLLLLVTSCSDIIMVEDISGNNMHVLAPTDGALLNGNIVTFTWQKVADAENYTIQIAKPNFANAVQIITDSTTTSLNFTKELEIGPYQWRVRGENSEYHTAYSTQSFIIE